ncbi:ATP-binding cassette domain-containing protein [Candidatus Poribacteria bacterium]|nr:ATP-binding cassette domain-containing protein [Candidatus Poribacteria bacterium]
MIEVQNLYKNYGPFQALKDISFDVEKGQIVGFLGPNGAGKTTTMRILTCFMPASSGKVTVAGYDVFKESKEVRNRIGYLPENIPLYTEMTVIKYLSYMGKIRNVSRKQLNNRLDSVIESCGLIERRNQIIGQLSRGYRQRVGLAQALIHDPEVLILDEPTSGLDPRQIVEIRDLIKGLGKERTILFSTHILPEAKNTCERLLVISKGQITGDIELKNGRAIPKTETHSVNSDDELSNEQNKIIENTINLVVSGAANDEILSTLKKIPFVINADSPSENTKDSYRVYYQNDIDIRPEVAKTIVENGWNLIEMSTDEMSLEELFLSLTSENVTQE